VLLRLEPMAVSGLFRSISAQGHAAPPSRAAARVVGKEERANRPFAGFHV
jgi:hypothetical protein